MTFYEAERYHIKIYMIGRDFENKYMWFRFCIVLCMIKILLVIV